MYVVVVEPVICPSALEPTLVRAVKVSPKFDIVLLAVLSILLTASWDMVIPDPRSFVDVSNVPPSIVVFSSTSTLSVPIGHT